MKIYALSLLLSFLSVCTYSQEAADHTLPTTPDKLENSLLWQISGNGLTNPSYLFGTIHIIGKDDFFLADNTKEAFAKSKKAMFEIDTEEMFSLTTQFSLLMRSFMKDGKRLRDLLTEEDYRLVVNHFSKIGLPMPLLERVKPMILSIFASEDLTKGSKGGEMKSYEIELTQLARAQKKSIAGLETAEYQMSMFDSIPYEAQAKMLIETIKTEISGDDGEDQFAIMVELYKNEDLHGMQNLVVADKDGIGQYDNLLLTQRNKNWIPIMSAQMQKQITFFAVGAGHLGGKDGVIALLRKEGYTVTPMRGK